jgi:hypothetical protein
MAITIHAKAGKIKSADLRDAGSLEYGMGEGTSQPDQYHRDLTTQQNRVYYQSLPTENTGL